MFENTIIEDFEDLNLEDLFYEHEYSKQHELIKSSKEKDAILYQGYYYNHKRDNKDGSSIYKCRESVIDNGKTKECVGVLKLTTKNTVEVKSHHKLCKAMHPIECDILKFKIDIKLAIDSNPTASVQQMFPKTNMFPHCQRVLTILKTYLLHTNKQKVIYDF